VFVVLSVWNYNEVLAIISAAVVVLTAAYILWTLQRVYLGAEYRGPHEDHLTPATLRENVIAGTLFVFAILFGVFPYRIPVINAPSILAYMEPTITRQVNELAEWTRRQQNSGAITAQRASDEIYIADRPVNTEVKTDQGDYGAGLQP
jgi:NADH-quinone oxidoreductase subunit M